MQKRIYLELPKENGPRFYYREEPFINSKNDLVEFLEWDKNMENYIENRQQKVVS